MKTADTRTPLTRLIWIILIIVGIGGIIWWQKRPKPFLVEVEQVSLDTIVERVSASGKIYPVDEIKITSEVSGEIRELWVKEGDSVKIGDLLAQIRPDNLIAIKDRNLATLNSQKANYARAKAQSLQAQARLTKAELDLKRNQSLLDQKVIALQEFESFLSQYQVAKAEYEAALQNEEAARYTVASASASLDEAEKNLKLTNIYAPMTGIITKLSVDKGERVVGTAQMAGTEMMRIANLNTMEVRVNISENDIIKVHKNDTTLIEVDAYSYTRQKFKGIVSNIANSANESLGSSAGGNTEQITEFTVKILLLPESYRHLSSDGQSAFRPGMTATVEIITNTKPNVATLPITSIAVRDETELSNNPLAKTKKPIEVVFVYDEKEERAKMRPVITGSSDFERIEILSGVAVGETVITSPYLLISKQLKNNDRVIIK